MENIKKAYQDILEVASKYKELGKQSEFNDIEKIIESAENHLFIVDWYEKYGLNIKHDVRLRGYDYVRINEYMYFSYFRDASFEKESGYGRYISWEDNGNQPKEEWLLCLTFSTGAYIFGDDYPVDLFSRFWQELKSYDPKYCDTHNNCLYFSIYSSSKIFNEFDSILKKYREINKDEAKQRKIDKLQKELKILKS